MPSPERGPERGPEREKTARIAREKVARMVRPVRAAADAALCLRGKRNFWLMSYLRSEDNG